MVCEPDLCFLQPDLKSFKHSYLLIQQDSSKDNDDNTYQWVELTQTGTMSGSCLKTSLQCLQRAGHNVCGNYPTIPSGKQCMNSSKGLRFSTVFTANSGLGWCFPLDLAWNGSVMLRICICAVVTDGVLYGVGLLCNRHFGDSFAAWIRQFALQRCSASPLSPQHKCNRSFWFHGSESLPWLLWFNKLSLSYGFLVTNKINVNRHIKLRTIWKLLYRYEKLKIPLCYGYAFTSDFLEHCYFVISHRLFYKPAQMKPTEIMN